MAVDCCLWVSASDSLGSLLTAPETPNAAIAIVNLTSSTGVLITQKADDHAYQAYAYPSKSKCSRSYNAARSDPALRNCGAPCGEATGQR